MFQRYIQSPSTRRSDDAVTTAETSVNYNARSHTRRCKILKPDVYTPDLQLWIIVYDNVSTERGRQRMYY
jgi:hypothetical protein